MPASNQVRNSNPAQQIEPIPAGGRILYLGFLFLFAGVVVSTELLAEFFDSAHRVNELLFSGVEWVRGAGNINEVNVVLVAVFPLNCFGCANGRLGKYGKIRGLVFEDDRAIFFRVRVVFHHLPQFLTDPR